MINHIISLMARILSYTLKIRCTRIHYLSRTVKLEEEVKKVDNMNFHVKALSYDDFFKGDPLFFNDRKMHLYRQRFQDASYHAYGIIHDGILVYSGWVCTEKITLPIKHKHILLKNNEGYLEDDYCHPHFRCIGIHTQMIAYRVNKLLMMGKNRIIVLVADGNLPALKALYKNGFKNVDSFYVGKIFGKRFITVNRRKYKCLG